MKWLIVMIFTLGVLKADPIREVILGNKESAKFDPIKFKVTNIIKGKELDIFIQRSVRVNNVGRQNGKISLSYVTEDTGGPFIFIQVPVCPKFKKLEKYKKIDDLIHILGKAHCQGSTVLEWGFFSKLKNRYQVCFFIVHITENGNVEGVRYGEGYFAFPTSKGAEKIVCPLVKE